MLQIISVNVKQMTCGIQTKYLQVLGRRSIFNRHEIAKFDF